MLLLPIFDIATIRTTVTVTSTDNVAAVTYNVHSISTIAVAMNAASGATVSYRGLQLL